MLQAAVCDCGPFDAVPFGEDRLGSSKIDVSGREVVDALVIADVVIVLDEGVDLLLASATSLQSFIGARTDRVRDRSARPYRPHCLRDRRLCTSPGGGCP